MKRSPIVVALFTALPLLGLACSVAAPDESGASASAVQDGNGREMNGREMNGREMNGREMNGTSAGVWYARRAGATIQDPSIATKTKVAGLVGGTIFQGPVFGGTVSNPLSSIALEHGQLIGVRPSGARVTGTSFKDIYLVGRGPKPALVVAGGVLTGSQVYQKAAGAFDTGTTATTTTTTTTTTAGPVAAGTVLTGTVGAGTVVQAESTATKIKAYVAKRLAETNVPERDVSLHVLAAVPTAPVNAFHNYTPSARWHYRVEVKDDDGVYRPFCPANADGTERLAIAIPDRFSYVQGLLTATERGGALITDASSFTFACDNAAVAKCVEHLHYDPELTVGQVSSSAASFAYGASMKPLLESCVRMFRADFCGNGLSMTLDGTGIDVADSPQLNTATSFSDPAWSLEASWRPEGASCAQKERQVCVPTGGDGTLARMAVKDYIDAICPGVVDSASDSDDHMCFASHYFPGVPNPTGGGGGVTTGAGGHFLVNPELHAAAINTGGGTNGTTFNETDVIWTTTKTSTTACANSIQLAQVNVAQTATINR